MVSTLYLDIETIPDQRPGALEAIRETITPPATYKKPESIAAWMDKNADAEAETKWRKTALDGSRGEICVIGYAINDGPPDAIHGDSEQIILETFARHLAEKGVDPYPIIVGHNVIDFDLRFLWQRSVINGIRPYLDMRIGTRYPVDVFDTMKSWCGFGNRISLDNLCAALGVESPKGEITGATVWDHVNAGNIEGVAEYCCHDIIATRECHQKMSFKGAA